jgi:hypothetical protein
MKRVRLADDAGISFIGADPHTEPTRLCVVRGEQGFNPGMVCGRGEQGFNPGMVCREGRAEVQPWDGLQEGRDRVLLLFF